MADIRIKDLATTAASTASDDFLAVDGSANGTRKLNAYSPTFGGNLTVSGTGTSSFAGVAQFAATKGVTFNTSTDIGAYGIGFKNDGSKFPIRVSLVNDSGTPRYFQVGYYSNDTQAGTWTNSFEVNAQNGNATLAGNLTVSGTGTSSVAGSLGIATTSPNKSSFSTAVTVNGATNSGFEVAVGDTRIAGFYAASSIAVLNAFANVPLAFSTNNTTQMQLFANGNLFVGASPTDGGQKLQVSGAVMATGSGEFGAGQLELKGSANAIKTFYINRYGVASGSQHFIRATATPSLEIVTANSESIVLSPNGTTALTLDSSQNATFAGNIKTAAPSGGTAATWRLGTVASVSPTSPNRTIEVEIGGTTYYIHAKTTND